MKFIYLIILLFSVLSCSSTPLKFGVISDIHYLSEQLMDGGDAINVYVVGSGRDVIDVPPVLDKVLDEYGKSDIDFLLIAGDLTKDGEKQSHIDLVSKLSTLKKKDIRVFVVPGNHDVNIPRPLKYEGQETIQVENVSPEEFAEIYSEFGYKEALYRDGNSLSYVAELNPETWLLAIDACRYREHTDKAITGGRIYKETEEWILHILELSKDSNKQVMVMMHHGVVEHILYQSVFFEQYLIEDWKRFASIFADYGVRFVFTGHFHSNDISEFTSEKGNTIYDVETGALVSYPFPYRFVEYTPERVKINTRFVTEIPSRSNLHSYSKEILKNLAYRVALQKIKGRMPDFPEVSQTELADIASELYLLHVKGDELIDEELQQRIKLFADNSNLPIDLSPEFFQLDFPPADNDLEIVF